MIRFSTISIPLPSLDYDLVSRWIEAVADAHGFSTGRINYILCDDDHILEVNRKHLNHDYYTDIITFDYSVPAKFDSDGILCRRGRIAGDIFISVDTVASNAVAYGAEPSVELLRVIIHGVLHLCGINDKGPGEREIMEAHENEALALYWRLRDSDRS